MQGRVMTSSADGSGGLSFGWINRELVSSGEFVEHINVFGGEDRFWLGPEGGQFSIFFKNKVPFDLEHWFTPAPIDTEPFELVSASKNRAVLKKDMRLENYSQTVFDLRVDREVRVLGKGQRAGNYPGRERENGCVRVEQQGDQYRPRGMEERNRFAVDLDSRHVQSLAYDYGCGSLQYGA
jgi:hypothetical protein